MLAVQTGHDAFKLRVPSSYDTAQILENPRRDPAENANVSSFVGWVRIEDLAGQIIGTGRPSSCWRTTAKPLRSY
ncbi:hypothetical protein AGIG_G34 [Arapaima gigas]